MWRTLILLVLVITIGNACIAGGERSIYGNHSDLEFEDMRIVADCLKIVVLEKDFVVSPTSLRDRLINDKYVTTKVKHQSFYLFEYPLESEGGAPIVLREKKLFYARDDDSVEHFRIMSTGKLICTPQPNQPSHQNAKWDSSFVVFDPLTMKSIGPIYKCRATELIFNESLDRFAAVASRSNAVLEMNGQQAQVNAIYGTENGLKLSTIAELPTGHSYGLSGWGLLVGDASTYLAFRKRSPVDSVYLGGRNYLLTNNLCAIENLSDSSLRVIYTSNWVALSERVDGKLYFLADNSTPAIGKPIVFDEQGHQFVFPGALPNAYRTMNWDTKLKRIAFGQLPHITEHEESTAQPISLIFWDYTHDRAVERKYDSECIRSLTRR